MDSLDYRKWESLLSGGKSFSITDLQYEEITGSRLPQDVHYVKRKSPLAKTAKKYGYTVEVLEEPVTHRVVNFIKNYNV